MGVDFQIASFGDKCHVALVHDLVSVVLAGDFCLAFEDEDYEVVVEVGFMDGFTFVQGDICYSCNMVIVVVDQFRAVLASYETVILHIIQLWDKNYFLKCISLSFSLLGGGIITDMNIYFKK